MGNIHRIFRNKSQKVENLNVGLDEYKSSSEENSLITIEEYVECFIDSYIEQINTDFKAKYEVDSRPFTLYEKDKIWCLIIENDLSMFSKPALYFYAYIRNDNGEAFVISREKMSEHKECNHYDFPDYRSYMKNIAENLDPPHEVLYCFDATEFSLNRIAFKPLCINMAEINIRSNLESYNRIMSKPVGSFHLMQSYKYTRIDLEDISIYFESSQLTALFNEAIFCYENHCYLASAATLGVALEEICSLILLKNLLEKDKGKIKDKTLFLLNKMLEDEKIIDNRMFDRIRNGAILRNLAAHTSSGYVVQSDCDGIITVIKALFDDYILKVRSNIVK